MDFSIWIWLYIALCFAIGHVWLIFKIWRVISQIVTHKGF